MLVGTSERQEQTEKAQRAETPTNDQHEASTNDQHETFIYKVCRCCDWNGSHQQNTTCPECKTVNSVGYMCWCGDRECRLQCEDGKIQQLLMNQMESMDYNPKDIPREMPTHMLEVEDNPDEINTTEPLERIVQVAVGHLLGYHR